MAATLDAGTGSQRASRYWRVVRQGLAWVLFAVAVYFLWPSSLGGGTSLVIVSGESMEPTYYSGDIVVARSGAPQVGDVIVYAPEGLGGAQVVHRIIGGDGESGWELQGDNNDFIDPFRPAEAEVRGIVQFHVANAGAVTMRILNPLVWCGVILAATVLALWPSDDDSDDEPDDDGDEPEDEVHGAVPDNEDHAAPVATATATATVATVAAKTASRLGRKRLGFAALAGGLSLLTVACATPASAAQLTVVAGSEVFSHSATACAPAQVAGAPVIDTTGADGTSAGVFSLVDMGGVPADCHGLYLEVFVHDSSGTVIASGDGTASAAGTIDVGNYPATSVVTVVARIGGWIFPTTWTAPAPTGPADPVVGSCEGYLMSTGEIPAATSCSLSAGKVGAVKFVDQHNGGPGHYRTIQMSTQFSPGGYMSPDGWRQYQDITEWRFALDLTAPPYGTGLDLSGSYYLYNNGNNAALASGEDCSDPTSVVFQERTVGSNPTAGFVVSEVPIAWMAPDQFLCSRP
ncbi:signal peptidase I [Demequina sp. SO4-18]|uniref:signal peptidase I n=1 Tax=Demequina sp. SO4-18 TaxID=3401026 RepID=UPI003B594212